MKLERLCIIGFKNLKNIELGFSNNNELTVLIGNNGSGKSNILEAISAIFCDFYNINNRGRKKLNFSYLIIYNIEVDGIENKILSRYDNKNSKYYFLINNYDEIKKTEIKNYLPSRLIALYSGEEIRLWEEYYQDFYKKYIDEIRLGAKSIEEQQDMLYINKYHWNIALLTMFASDVNLEEIIGKISIDTIKMSLNRKTLENFGEDSNQVTSFCSNLFGENDSLKINLQDFKDRADYETHVRLFSLLSVANLPKDNNYKLINNIDITFNNKLKTNDFSEGDKKRILLKFILDVLSNKKTLFLLDEPDAHIHVANKQQIKTLFEESNTQIIITTHSPTLMSVFEDNLVYLEDGKISNKENMEILKEISGNTMSFEEQQIVLHSNNDIILVEGKTDIKFLKTALDKIDDKTYINLKHLEYVPTGGASGLRLFVDKFQAKENQNIIAILDSDKAGNDEIKELLENDNKEELEERKFTKLKNIKNTFIMKLPKLDRISNNEYEIEDFFPLEKLVEISKKQIDTFKVLKDFKFNKNYVKKELMRTCYNFSQEDFKDFRSIFDLIKEIKENE